MYPMLRPFAIAILIFLAFASCVTSQAADTTGVICGTVTDAETGEPLPNVAVQILEAYLGALTRPDGGYTIEDVPCGSYQLHVRLVDYEIGTLDGVHVTSGDTTTANFQLNWNTGEEYLRALESVRAIDRWLTEGDSSRQLDLSQHLKVSGESVDTLANPGLLLALYGDYLEDVKEREERYRAVFLIGCLEADREWADECATVYTRPRGHGGWGLSVRVDTVTGLPFTYGNSFHPYMGWAHGHNARLETLLDLHGIPSYNRKQWLPEILDPEAYFESRAENETALPIGFGPPGLISPDGVFEIWCESAEDTLGDDIREWPYFFVRSDCSVKTGWGFLGSCDSTIDISLFWGPQGSDVAAIHHVQPKSYEEDDGTVVRTSDIFYGILDLRTARWLSVVDSFQIHYPDE